MKESVDTPAGPVPVAGTSLSGADRRGAAKVRAGFGRMRYTVPPGLYAVGAPGPTSPVLVSANYKLSFDHLRSAIAGLAAWILVLDTRGINVWCAAGKGTFGTDEIVHRVRGTRLADVVSHRKLVAPQLGAPGVAAHEVRERTGFAVHYGPVRAPDIPAFLEARMKATPEMRRVDFPARDRAVLIPMELFGGAKLAIAAAIVLAVLAGLGRDVYSVERALSLGGLSAALLLGAYVASNVLFPLLLPWLPGRAFAVKGAWLGLVVGLAVTAAARYAPAGPESWLAVAGWTLMAIALGSFLGLNFTGSSTFTSLSGVLLETRVAVPIQGVLAVAGLGLWLIGRFV